MVPKCCPWWSLSCSVVLTLPSCYNAEMVVEMAEVLAGPRLAVGIDQLCCRFPALRRSGQLRCDWQLLYKILWSEYSLILN